MRTMTIRRNATRRRKARRKTARAPRSRVTVTTIAKPRRRRRRAAAPVARVRRRSTRRVGLSRPRRRMASRTKPLGMIELLGLGGAGAIGTFAAEYALDRVPMLHEKIESETGRAVAKTGVTVGLTVLAVAATRKSKARTRKMVNAAAIGAVSASVLKLGKTLYDEHVAKNGEEQTEEGVSGILPNQGRVIPMNGINAAARRGIRAPARRGIGYVSPAINAGPADLLNPRSADMLDNALNGRI